MDTNVAVIRASLELTVIYLSINAHRTRVLMANASRLPTDMSAAATQVTMAIIAKTRLTNVDQIHVSVVIA
jgi:hypothetical protein